MTVPSAEYFDRWYADMQRSPTHEDIAIRTLGLPPQLESTSLLPWAGITDITEALAIQRDDVLVDLACGRGGYGLEVARRAGAALIGVDFSAVAIARARQKAGDGAEFRVGELTSTGLPNGSADAVMCIDAMQFSEPYDAGLAECLRILRPGGRLVLTGWQALDLADVAVPARMRHDIAAALDAAGFVEVSVENMLDWRAAESTHWQLAIALEPGTDAALESLRDEGVRIAGWLERTIRVLAVGRAPAPS